ncbi:MAG TPA: glutaredoxin family protein [Chthoniobacterales bacterium]
MSTHPIRLYVKPGCPWCTLAERYLEKHGYAYERLDVIKDRTAYAEMKTLSGQTRAPTLVAGDSVLPDFGPEELAEFLQQNGIRP